MKKNKTDIVIRHKKRPLPLLAEDKAPALEQLLKDLISAIENKGMARASEIIAVVRESRLTKSEIGQVIELELKTISSEVRQFTNTILDVFKSHSDDARDKADSCLGVVLAEIRGLTSIVISKPWLVRPIKIKCDKCLQPEHAGASCRFAKKIRACM